MPIELVAGDKAIAQSKRLISSLDGGLLGIACELEAGRDRPCEVLAFCSADATVLIDAGRTPGLGHLLTGAGPLAAIDTKRHAHALWARDRYAGTRWADPFLLEQLIRGTSQPPTALADLAHAYGQNAASDPQTSLVDLVERAQLARRLARLQGIRLAQDGMSQVSRLEAQATAPIVRMEAVGLAFDRTVWSARIRREQTGQVSRLADLQPAADARTHTSKLGSANEEALLTHLQRLHPEVSSLAEEHLARLPSRTQLIAKSYLDSLRRLRAHGEAFLDHVDSDGRIRATFSQIGARTGRMACTAPNLQGIPRGRDYRASFCPKPGRILVLGDYSACELRILAEMSRDRSLIGAFAEGRDVHQVVAQQIFGAHLGEQEARNARQRAKSLSFGLIYGMGAPGLARQLGIAPQEASALIKHFFQAFPDVEAFLIDGARTAVRRGYAESRAGRRLYLTPENEAAQQVNQRLRLARNMPIQGTSADIIKLALGRLHRQLPQRGPVWIVHCVHDEIVLECDRAEAGAVETLLKEAMEAAAAELIQMVPVIAETAARSYWSHED